MIQLDILNPAWQRYLGYLNEYFNSRGEIGTVESITRVINSEYNGVVLEQDDWRVYFKTDQDLAFFLLKWS